MVWGSIIGDVVGSHYEFLGIKSKELPFFKDNTTFTDDTVMTVAICELLLIGKDPADTFHRYFHLEPFRSYGNYFAQWCMNRISEPYNSFGNGALMRISPCAYISNDLNYCLEKAEELTNVTHNHPESIKAVRNFITLIWKLKRKQITKEEVRDFLWEDGYDIRTKTLDKIRPNYKFDETCQGSYPESVLAFVESNSFEDALRNSMSLGGDVDTMCSITGAIAEAYYEIPHDLYIKTRDLISEELVEVIDEFTDYFRL